MNKTCPTCGTLCEVVEDDIGCGLANMWYEPVKPEWTLVEDAPDAYEECWLVLSTGEMGWGSRDKAIGWWQFADSMHGAPRSVKNVTHWRYFERPDPPEVE